MTEQLQTPETIGDRWALLNSAHGIAESGGEENNTATDFSRFWAVALLIQELESDNRDYVLVFEFLQDVAVLFGDQAPTKAILYQIKKKQRNSWNKSSLLGRRSGESKAEGKKSSKKLLGESPLGKLYVCVKAASDLVGTEGVFLSDGPFELRTKGEELLHLHSKTRIDELSLADEFRIRQSLAKELKDSALEQVGSMQLQQCRITPGAMREYAEGVIARHLNERFPGKPNVSGRVLEKLLFEFSQKSGNKPTCATFAEIIHHKGFTRQQFNNLLLQMVPTRSWEDRLDTLIADLKANGADPRSAERWRRQAQTLNIRLVGSPKVAQSYGWESAIQIAHSSAAPYLELLNQISEFIRKEQTRSGRKPLSNDERYATGIVAILHVENEPAPTNPKSEVETE
jgi:hypothetical protein